MTLRVAAANRCRRCWRPARRIAIAQAWSLQGGAVGRGSSTTTTISSHPPIPQSGFTASITPFVTAARRTETSDVAALVAVGANKVWGLSSNVDYRERPFRAGRLGARRPLDVDRETRHLSDRPSCRTTADSRRAPLVLAFTNSASASGALQRTRSPIAGRSARRPGLTTIATTALRTARHFRTTMATTPAATPATRIRRTRSSRLTAGYSELLAATSPTTMR